MQLFARVHHAAVRSGARRQTRELDTGHLLHNPADVFDGAIVRLRLTPVPKGEFRSGCVEANGLRPQPARPVTREMCSYPAGP